MRSGGNVASGLALAATLVFGTPATAQEDAVGVPSFQEGDVISFEELERIEPYLPPEFWANRDFFFFEGMQLEIGPSYRDYAPADVYKAATDSFAGQAEIGPENSLAGYTAGQPFPMEKIDCKGDPQAGAKIIWNFDRRWNGDGSMSSFYYSYWDRGEELPLFYEGTSKTIQLSQRTEPQYLKSGGDIFRGEKRKSAFGVEVTAPFDARGIMVMTYRYKDSQKPEAETKNDALEAISRLISDDLAPDMQRPIFDALAQRERLASTGIGEQVAIPHGKLDQLDTMVAGLARSRAGVDFGAIDGQATRLFFVIVAPGNANGLHLRALARVARLCRNNTFRTRLLEAEVPSEMYDVLLMADAEAASGTGR